MADEDAKILPLTIWAVSLGPNPWKIVTICEELSVPYEIEALLKPGQLKRKPFTDVNPNGRVPAIYDPNTDITLWESGAIVLYLIEQYDKNNLLSYTTLRERQLCNQWLFYQVTGQGPYFGQFIWFQNYHEETVASASERYAKEIKRILGVLEGELSKRSWLVGDRMTYADTVFVMWNHIIKFFYDTPQDPLEDFPAVKEWQARLIARPAFRKTELLRWKYQQIGGLSPDTGLPLGMTIDDALLECNEELRRTKPGLLKPE